MMDVMADNFVDELMMVEPVDNFADKSVDNVVDEVVDVVELVALFDTFADKLAFEVMVEDKPVFVVDNNNKFVVDNNIDILHDKVDDGNDDRGRDSYILPVQKNKWNLDIHNILDVIN